MDCLPFAIFSILVAISVPDGGRGHASNGECEAGKAEGLLNAAVDLFTKAKDTLLKVTPEGHHPPCPNRPVDCSDIAASNRTTKSGIYRIWPRGRVLENPNGFEVYCDMKTGGGGWTVIQRRGDYGRPKDYFYEDWQHYKTGFGDIDKDFWMGNDKIYTLTNQAQYSLRFDLNDGEESRMALYRAFWVEDESRSYTLHVKGYTGTAGDSFVPVQDGMMFSTKDRDNDKNPESCAVSFKGAWWYNTCHVSNLNGLYLKGTHPSFADGIEWHTWKGYNYSLIATEMKIRPHSYIPPVDIPR